jgi:hypothetical protein
VVVGVVEHAKPAIVAVSRKRNARAGLAINVVSPKQNALVRRSPPAPSVRRSYDTQKRWVSIASIYFSLTLPLSHYTAPFHPDAESPP